MEKNHEQYEQYKLAIRNAMITTDDEYEIDDNGLSEISKRLVESAGLIKGGDYEFPEDLYFISGKDVLDSSKKSSLKRLRRDDTLTVIVDSIEEKVKASAIIPQKVRANYIYIQSRNRDDDYCVDIDKRLNSIYVETKDIINENCNAELEGGAVTDEKAVTAVGQIFVAKLYDLVSLYNETGDSLFSKNVRSGLLNDKNSVDSSIHETLSEEPEKFWFYNNGITLLADKVECRSSNRIKIVSSNDNEFSVINGAQTITACADYFYNPQIDEDKIENAKKNAYVMLRIVSVKEHGDKVKNTKDRLENKISVSLNRQKPIDSEDLAFNSELVYMINSLETDSSVGFNVRRKGDSIADSTYLLTQVARFVLASKLQRPGAAKNMYRANILKMDGDSFKIKDVFPQLKGTSIEKDFINQFGLVNISKKLYDGMDDCVKKEERNVTLLKNGHYYFIAVVVKALFASTSDGPLEINLENIKNVSGKISDKDVLNEIYQKYSDMIVSITRDRSVDYKELKKEDKYVEILESDEFKEFREDVRKIVFGE